MSDDTRGSEQALGATMPGVGGGTDLAPGATVGEYRIERVLGRGGMGVVYAAIQPVIEKKVAVKVLSAQFSGAPELVRRFIDEARAVNRIGHENIVDIFSFGQLPDGRQYFVMEYLEGATLAERLERGDLAPAEVPKLIAQVCDALEAAHGKKIVHRDLKPENIWVGATPRGEPRVRLLDFGIAKLLDVGDQVVTDIGAVMGTPHFMSPEQCHGRGVDHRTDIYALGVIMYRVFTGKLPFTGETYAQILAKQITELPAPPASVAPMPAPLDALVMRCLAKEPAARPQSAGEVATTLAAIVSGKALPAPMPIRVTAAPQDPTMLSRPATVDAGEAPGVGRGRVVAVVVALAVVAAIAAGVALTRGGSSPPAIVDRPPAPVAAPPAPAPARVAPPAAVPPAPEVEAPAPVAKRRVAPAKAAPSGEAPTHDTGEASRARRNGLVTDNPFK